MQTTVKELPDSRAEVQVEVPAAEVVVTGPEAPRFAEAALKLPFLNRVLLRAPSAEALPPSHPAQAKIAAAGSAAFICVGETCSLPVSDPDALAAAIRAARG